MLTGDKIDTAINIGFSAALLGQGTHILRLEQRSKRELMEAVCEALEIIEKQGSASVATVVEGESFFKICQSQRLTAKFVELALASKVVIACRLSPKQKSEVIQLIRANKPSAITLAIGDGANDVSMITEANIGIGLAGNEGNQAVSSADYALAQFKDLRTLLLYHGREAYRRNAYVICYMFYKNLLLNLPIALYGCVSGFSGQIFFERIDIQIFNVIFTSWPIIIYATWDLQHSRETLLSKPRLYEDGPNRLHFNPSVFTNWLVFTLVQSVIILMVSLTVLNNAIATIGIVGPTPDMWLIGTLLYFSVIVLVTVKLW